MGVTELFERGADLYAARPCLIDAGGSRTYAEVRQRRDFIASALIRAGLKRNERCSVYAANSSNAFECILAIYKAGGVFVPLNPRHHVSENAYTVDQCEVTTIFHDSALASEVRALRDCASARRTLCIDGDCEGSDSLEAWMGAEPLPPIAPSERDELISIYSTGGTTGRPKGVMFTPLTWEIMAANLFASLPCPEPPVYLVVSPITHAAGTIGLLLMSMGATFVIQTHFDAADVLSAIEKHRVSHLYLPPTAIYALLSHPGIADRDFSSLKAFIYTSAPMSTEKLRQCLAIFGPVMVQFWGQTEAPCFCTCLTASDHVLPSADLAHRLKSCGRPMLLTPVEVMGPDGSLLPTGERGELVVRGNLVMSGYYKNPEATEEVSRHGWHHTGDVGYKDADGYVYIVDRMKDMIISGGFNVYPSEIEQLLWSHPSIQDCAVVGVPDDKWGEAVRAIIELKPGHHVDPGDVITFCKASLGSVKAPKTVEIWSELPRTPVGKIDKKSIRSRFWTGLGRSI
ncbi:class I adenylate-forming enzyme family protein [Xanthobacteraceae bacterium A53D]